MAEVDSLSIKISSTADQTVSELNNLVGVFQSLRTSIGGDAGGLSKVSKQLKAVSSATQYLSNDGSERIKSFANAMRSLQGLDSIKFSSSISKQISNLSTAISGIKWTDGDKLEALANGLRPLSQLGKANLNSFINQISKLPAVLSELDKLDMGKFAKQMQQVANAVKPLATEMQKVSNGFAAFPIRIQKIIQSNTGLIASNKKAASSFSGLTKSLGTYTLFGLGISQISKGIAGLITNANSYVENMNLFSTAMGDYYNEAMSYANLVSTKLGVDVSEWIRNQGIFMSIATGFGLATEQAYAMSRGLTELSYDLSSFFNISLDAVGDGAFAKVQSGISGELEPLRRLGFALDQATLQQVAYDHGVQQSIATMTQAQKAVLRYTAIVEQAADMGVIGDMAKTLESPANALRILRQQFNMLAREIGNILIPSLAAILPWVQAVVEVLTEAARAIAKLFGFNIADWSYSDWEGMNTGLSFGEDAAEGLADNLGNAAANAKKIKEYTLGIDELNIINEQNTGGGGSGAAANTGWEADWEIDSVWDENVIAGITRKVDELKPKLEDLLSLATVIGATMLGWHLGPAVMTGAAGLTSIFTGIRGKVSELASAFGVLSGKIQAPTQNAATLANSLKFAGVLGVLAVIITRFSDLYKNSEKFREGIDRIGEVFQEVGAAIQNILSGVWDKLKEVGLAVLDMLPEPVKQAILDALSAISGFVKDLNLDWGDLAITVAGFALLFVPGGQILGVVLLAFEAITIAIRGIGSLSDETWAGIKQTFVNIALEIKNRVVQYFTGIVTFLKGVFTGDISLIADGFFDIFDSTFGNIVRAIERMLPTGIREAFRNAINGARNLLNSFIGWINDRLKISIPSILGITRATTFKLFTLPKIPAFAEGGFPDHGQMFIAREAGPELVGQIGNRAAVANNDQIITGIAEGVRNANEEIINVLYAVAQQAITAINNQSSDIYLDGAKVGSRTTQAQNRANRMYGKTLQNA